MTLLDNGTRSKADPARQRLTSFFLTSSNWCRTPERFFFVAMKPVVLFFIALGLAGVRAAPVPRIQALTQNVCDDKLAIIDCTLVRRGNEDGVSSQVGQSAVPAEEAKQPIARKPITDEAKKVNAERARIRVADLKLKDPVAYTAMRARKNEQARLRRANTETKDQRMKRLQSLKNYYNSIKADPIRGPPRREQNIATSKRNRLIRKQRLASTTPLTDTNPADSSTQVAPHGASVHPQVQHSDAHSYLQQAAPPGAQLTVGHGASSSVTQAAHVDSAAIDYWLSDDLDTLPHLTAEDIRLFTT